MKVIVVIILSPVKCNTTFPQTAANKTSMRLIFSETDYKLQEGKIYHRTVVCDCIS